MISNDVVLGKGVTIWHPELVNLYGCTIGEGTKIASFVEIQKGVIVGKNCKIEAYVFLPTGVTVGDGVFIGPHVCFTNDKYPRATDPDGSLLGPDDWTVVPTVVEDRASIGANTTVICGTKIGAGALVGAGSVVTRNVPPGQIVCGNPAKQRGFS